MTMSATFLSRSVTKNMYTRQGSLGLNCCFYLIIVTVLITLAFILSGFEARRSIGVYLLIIYGVFLIQSILSEAEILHGYGTDHESDIKIADIIEEESHARSVESTNSVKEMYPVVFKH